MNGSNKLSMMIDMWVEERLEIQTLNIILRIIHTKYLTRWGAMFECNLVFLDNNEFFQIISSTVFLLIVNEFLRKCNLIRIRHYFTTINFGFWETEFMLKSY